MMLYRLSAIHRAAGLLVLLLLLGGMCWLDTLDLTDDIQLSHPFAFGQQGVEPEEGREYLLSLLHGALALEWASPVASPPQSLSCAPTGPPSSQSNRPLYQSLCTYRI